MTSVKVTEELVEKVGSELVRYIEKEFSLVEARFATRRKLSQERSLEVQGFPAPSADFHGSLLLLVPPVNQEDIEAFAINRAAEIWEEQGIKVRIKVSNKVWCKNSVAPKSAPVTGSGSFPVITPSTPVGKKNGLEFWCRNGHSAHSWGRLSWP